MIRPACLLKVCAQPRPLIGEIWDGGKKKIHDYLFTERDQIKSTKTFWKGKIGRSNLNPRNWILYDIGRMSCVMHFCAVGTARDLRTHDCFALVSAFSLPVVLLSAFSCMFFPTLAELWYFQRADSTLPVHRLGF